MSATRLGLPIDWGKIAPLRLRARVVAEGVYAGLHHSRRRGAGVEFGGQRPYVPGDDLRFLDRRSLLKHDKLMVREFETDTDRALWLCLDATLSMSFHGPDAPAAKLAYAALLGAALARVAISGGDPVGLCWVGAEQARDLAPGTGEGGFERVVGTLAAARAGTDLRRDPDALARRVRLLAHRARRGSVVVFISDLLDLPAGAPRAVASLGCRSRALCVVQVLDPAERLLGYHGKVRLRAIEGDDAVTTDADAARAEYLAGLGALTDGWARAVQAEGGRLVRACSSDPPIDVVRDVVRAVAEARR
ncbi:MAG: DUF58 domain-containing protein [Deltaproteobacteria bacterium]|nr:DUF58 domain-containing protein [Deltaproteobacteria bacterium]